MNQLPPLNALKSFVEAGQALSFTKAAAQLNVTPGAVSRLVHKLEDHLGVSLFQRSPSGLELTPAGTSYLREVEGPLSAVAEATRRARDRSSHKRLKIACYPTFASRWLMPRWGRFFDRHPDIEVQIATTLTDIDLMADQTVDLAIQIGASTTPSDTHTELKEGLNSHHLLAVDLSPICRPELFKGLKSPHELIEALSDLTFVHSTALPKAWQHWLSSYAAASDDPNLVEHIKQLDPSRGLVFETQNLAFQAALEGMGVAIGIKCLVEEELQGGQLIEPFEFRRRSTQSFRVLHRRTSEDSKSAMLYRDWLLEEAAASQR